MSLKVTAIMLQRQAVNGQLVHQGTSVFSSIGLIQIQCNTHFENQKVIGS